jgi:hypothetical protein
MLARRGFNKYAQYVKRLKGIQPGKERNFSNAPAKATTITKEFEGVSHLVLLNTSICSLVAYLRFLYNMQ